MYHAASDAALNPPEYSKSPRRDCKTGTGEVS